ncbi:hypothetical protein, partial [Comamonas odontotermitis]|uniref:hypothetical protein n=1 Tax=Comamonas odontotermitis TaxID=379895 RepID=UPI001C8815CA
WRCRSCWWRWAWCSYAGASTDAKKQPPSGGFFYSAPATHKQTNERNKERVSQFHSGARELFLLFTAIAPHPSAKACIHRARTVAEFVKNYRLLHNY